MSPELLQELKLKNCFCPTAAETHQPLLSAKLSELCNSRSACLSLSLVTSLSTAQKLIHFYNVAFFHLWF